MKTFALLSVLAAGSLMAGEKSVIEPVAPPPAPTLWQWFVGGSVGYVADVEEEMYTLHAGVDLPNQLAGWDQALFLEVGWLGSDESVYVPCDSYATACTPTWESYDIDMVPVTVNYKLERALTESLNMYLGAGIGAANIDVDGPSVSDDDWAFYAQVFGGLLYNVSEDWEIYAGGRWLYIGEYTIDGMDADDYDDWMVEIGGRINL